ncbi:MAG: AMP-binding protein [Bacteroidota bacterium]
MMFLPVDQLLTYVKQQLVRICPRLEQHPNLRRGEFRGNWKDDWGVDSLEILELAAFFHGQFQMLQPGTTHYLLYDPLAESWFHKIQQAANDPAIPMLFQTSGSTGTPKSCFHAKADLTQEVDYLATQFPLANRIWSVVQAHHIYGFLFTVLLPTKLSCPVQDAQALPIPDLRMSPGDLLIGHPSWWQAWAQMNLPWQTGWRGVNSTGPLSPDTRTYFQGQAGEMLEVYGSSETGGIGIRNVQEEAYTLFPFLQRENEQLIRISSAGDKHELPLMDQLNWQSARHFQLAGRKDQAVQVGGINVFPLQIAARLQTIPGIKQAWVRKMNPQEGTRLKALIMPEESESIAPLQAKILDWIEGKLSVPERPRHLTFTQIPPTNEMGKVQDWLVST